MKRASLSLKAASSFKGFNREARPMKVYIVLDQIKACYDASDIFHGVYASREEAEESLSGYCKSDRECFDIEEEEI